MEILKTHYKLSKPVSRYSEIKSEAEAMKRFIVHGDFKGYYNKAFSLSHAQVSETPYAFFVVSPETLQERMFKHQVIINPRVVEVPVKVTMTLDDGKTKEQPNMAVYHEPCMSFPFREPKRIERPYRIFVQYSVPALGGLYLKNVDEWLVGIAAEIFQHETDHINAKNVYFDTEPPIKWWGLQDQPKPGEPTV